MTALYPCDFCDYYTEQHNKGCCCRVCYAARNGTAALPRTNDTFSGLGKRAKMPPSTAPAGCARCVHAKRPHHCHHCVLPPYTTDSEDKLFAHSCYLAYACERCGCLLEGQRHAPAATATKQASTAVQSKTGTATSCTSQGLSEDTSSIANQVATTTTTTTTKTTKPKTKVSGCTPCHCCLRGAVMKGIPYELYEIPKNGTAVYSYVPHARGQGKERDLQRQCLNAERMKFMY